MPTFLQIEYVGKFLTHVERKLFKDINMSNWQEFAKMLFARLDALVSKLTKINEMFKQCDVFSKNTKDEITYYTYNYFQTANNKNNSLDALLHKGLDDLKTKLTKLITQAETKSNKMNSRAKKQDLEFRVLDEIKKLVFNEWFDYFVTQTFLNYRIVQNCKKWVVYSLKRLDDANNSFYSLANEYLKNEQFETLQERVSFFYDNTYDVVNSFLNRLRTNQYNVYKNRNKPITNPEESMVKAKSLNLYDLTNFKEQKFKEILAIFEGLVRHWLFGKIIINKTAFEKIHLDLYKKQLIAKEKLKNRLNPMMLSRGYSKEQEETANIFLNDYDKVSSLTAKLFTQNSTINNIIEGLDSLNSAELEEEIEEYTQFKQRFQPWLNNLDEAIILKDINDESWNSVQIVPKNEAKKVLMQLNDLYFNLDKLSNIDFFNIFTDFTLQTLETNEKLVNIPCKAEEDEFSQLVQKNQTSFKR